MKINQEKLELLVDLYMNKVFREEIEINEEIDLECSKMELEEDIEEVDEGISSYLLKVLTKPNPKRVLKNKAIVKHAQNVGNKLSASGWAPK